MLDLQDEEGTNVKLVGVRKTRQSAVRDRRKFECLYIYI